MKVYISGPITGQEGYMWRFGRAEDLLRKAGHVAVNPAKVNAQLPEETEHGEYMKTSLAMLDMCDAMFMLEGWERSRGCAMELAYACRHGIMIAFEGGRA